MVPGVWQLKCGKIARLAIIVDSERSLGPRRLVDAFRRRMILPLVVGGGGHTLAAAQIDTLFKLYPNRSQIITRLSRADCLQRAHQSDRPAIINVRRVIWLNI